MRASLNAYLLGTDPVQRVMVATICTMGAVGIAIGTFALLKGYFPLIGAVSPLKAGAYILSGVLCPAMIVGATAMDTYRKTHPRRRVY